MTPQELKDLRERSFKKHEEIRAKMIELEQSFIKEYASHRLGDPHLIDFTISRNKRIENFGEIAEIKIDYTVDIPRIMYTVNRNGKGVKVFYEEV